MQMWSGTRTVSCSSTPVYVTFSELPAVCGIVTLGQSRAGRSKGWGIVEYDSPEAVGCRYCSDLP